MFKFWWTKDNDKVITKVRISFALDAEQVEHIVARSYSEITSKKTLKEAIDRFLWDNGWDFSSEYISHDDGEVEKKHAEAREIVKRFMPQLYSHKKRYRENES